MPIKVTCQCGQSFAAKDELAGKTVKCPKCTKPLRIPETGPRVGAPAAQQRPATTTQRPAASPAAAAPRIAAPLPSAGGASSLFDEAGLGPAVAGATPCPGCAAPLPPEVVLCVKCGYNRRLGRRMETVRMTAAPLAGGHDATATELLERAARMMEEEKEEERKKTKEGMPWWVYLIGLSGALGFMITMMLIPREMAMMVGGGTLLGVGVIVAIYAHISIMIIGFKENVGFGIMILVLGCWGSLIYSIMRWDRCGGLFLMWIGAQVIQGAGYAIFVFSSIFAENAAFVPLPHPQVAVVVNEDAAALDCAACCAAPLPGSRAAASPPTAARYLITRQYPNYSAPEANTVPGMPQRRVCMAVAIA